MINKIFAVLFFNYLIFAKTDLIIFSYDRPMQLYALLESINDNMRGLDSIYIIYRTSSQDYANSYDVVFKDFCYLNLNLFKQGQKPERDFKEILMACLYDIKLKNKKLVMFSVDDSIVIRDVDLDDIEFNMSKFNPFCFLIRMGKNITHSYSKNCLIKVANLYEISNDLLQWNFVHQQADWGYPTSLDMGLFWLKDCINAFELIKFENPNSLEFEWSLKAHKKCMGICYEHSKMITIPLNIVHNSKNRHMNSFNNQDLLIKFQQNLKMDIKKLYPLKNDSPHMECNPTFINR